MSLIGIRDLSVIETPPRERQPIQTFVTAQNKMVIKEAVMNEVIVEDRFSMFIIE